MREIDLIPTDYVRLRRLRRRLVRLVAALALVLGATATARAWIGWRVGSERAALAQVREQEKVVGDLHSRLVALRAKKAAGDAELATLRELRDGSASYALWLAIDGAYNDRVWLDGLSYLRTLRAPTPAAPLSIEHDAELNGHALDAAAVSEFLGALAERPGIATARLGDSALQQLAGIEVVAFSASATLGPPLRSSP